MLIELPWRVTEASTPFRSDCACCSVPARAMRVIWMLTVFPLPCVIVICPAPSWMSSVGVPVTESACVDVLLADCGLSSLTALEKKLAETASSTTHPTTAATTNTRQPPISQTYQGIPARLDAVWTGGA
jgi:hypothetical protein